MCCDTYLHRMSVCMLCVCVCCVSMCVYACLQMCGPLCVCVYRSVRMCSDWLSN